MASSNVEESAGNKPAKRKPVFTKVDQMKPGTNGHTLIAKVLSSETVLQKGGTRPSSSSLNNILRPTVISECLIGDETGTIIFTARNEQGSILLLFHLFSFLISKNLNFSCGFCFICRNFDFFYLFGFFLIAICFILELGFSFGVFSF
jgi:hypothetical protein